MKKAALVLLFLGAALAGKQCHEMLGETQHLIGAYIPQCEENGDFKRVQCHASTGFCWCVCPKKGTAMSERQRGGLEEEDCKAKHEEKAEEETTCVYGEQGTCESDSQCAWCLSAAIPSKCYTADNAAKLPAGVFTCTSGGGANANPLLNLAPGPVMIPLMLGQGGHGLPPTAPPMLGQGGHGLPPTAPPMLGQGGHGLPPTAPPMLGQGGHGLPPTAPPMLGQGGHGLPPTAPPMLGQGGHGLPPTAPPMLGQGGHGLPPKASVHLGRHHLRMPVWLTNPSAEKPLGRRNMGSWTRSFFTAEQQQRLGVDEDGNPSAQNQAKPVSAPASHAQVAANLAKVVSSVLSQGAPTTSGAGLSSSPFGKIFEMIHKVQSRLKYAHEQRESGQDADYGTLRKQTMEDSKFFNVKVAGINSAASQANQLPWWRMGFAGMDKKKLTPAAGTSRLETKVVVRNKEGGEQQKERLRDIFAKGLEKVRKRSGDIQAKQGLVREGAGFGKDKARSFLGEHKHGRGGKHESDEESEGGDWHVHGQKWHEHKGGKKHHDHEEKEGGEEEQQEGEWHKHGQKWHKHKGGKKHHDHEEKEGGEEDQQEGEWHEHAGMWHKHKGGEKQHTHEKKEGEWWQKGGEKSEESGHHGKGKGKHHHHKGKHHHGKWQKNHPGDDKEEGQQHHGKPRTFFGRIRDFFSHLFGRGPQRDGDQEDGPHRHGHHHGDKEGHAHHHGHHHDQEDEPRHPPLPVERSPRPQKLYGVHMHGMQQQQQPGNEL